MFKYNERKEKYLYFPIIFTSNSYFQYYWSKYLKFKILLFWITFNIIGMVPLLLLNIYFLKESIFHEKIEEIFCYLFISVFLVFNILLSLFFVKTKNDPINSKKTNIFLKTNVISNLLYWFSFLVFYCLEVSKKINGDPPLISSSIPFFFLIVFFIFIWIFLVYVVMRYSKFSNKLSNKKYPMNIVKIQNLNSFKYIYNDQEIWKDNEEIYLNNKVAKFIGIGFYKRSFEHHCLYIFNINDENIGIDFCENDLIIINQNVKEEAEKLLFSI